MSSEADIHREEEWFNEKLAQRCLDALKRNNIPGYYAADRSQALAQILGMIPSRATIGVGDSVTLYQAGIIEELEKRGSHQIFNPLRKEGEDYFPATMREWVEIGMKALSTDFFLTGLNAITLDGKIVNTDGTGNRVAGLLFGPKKVIAVAGINKIVANLEEATWRIKNIAAPINAYRHKIKHNAESPPCAINGVCVDCHHPQRNCCYTVIVEFQEHPRIEVVIVGEKLGI
ncbi:lactate utilization protein [Chloroflexota bacterium]